MFAITYAAALLSVILVVGAVAFTLSRTNTALARTLALYALTAAFWIGGNAAADVSYTVPALMLTSSIAYLGGALNLFLFLILVDLLIDRRMPSSMRLFVYALPTLGMSLFAFSKYAIEGTYFPINAPAQIIPGPLYLITFFILMSALTYSLIRLLRALSQEPGDLRRIQLSYVLLGLMLSLVGEIVFDIVLPLLGELRFYTLGPVTSIFFILGCAYAITERNLFDIRLIVQRGMVYSFLLTLIILAYTGLLSLVLLLSAASSTTAIYVSAGLTVVMGILGTPLITRFFTTLTDPLFFKNSYDSAEALHTLSEILYRHMDLETLIHQAEIELARIFKAESITIVYGASGIDEPDFDAVASGQILGVPITQGDVYSGSIHTGRKRSGDPYTLQDQRLLRTFAYQAATAFSRAELYERTKQHAQELEHTVEHRTEELRAIQAQERQTLIDLSHNLQTPLTVFQTKLEQLKQTTLAADVAYSLEQPIKRLSVFIYDLLALAKLESEESETHTHIDLSDIVSEIIEELEVISHEKGVRIESMIEPHLVLTGNEKRLREAILNVASNALTYLKDEGERCISFRLLQKDSAAFLTIVDTGRGISVADLPHVCERFYRGTSEERLPSGNGLGLAIAKRIIEQHHGILTLESTEGKGTSVHIQLPMR